MKLFVAVRQQGQAMILVLFVMVIGILITTGATYTLLSTLQTTTLSEVGSEALIGAESGLENGILRFIRDPSYTGETMIINSDQTATITVTPGPPITITSTSVVGAVVRRMQATVQYTDGILIVLTWQELP